MSAANEIYIFNFPFHTPVFWMFLSGVFSDVFLGIYEGRKIAHFLEEPFDLNIKRCLHIYVDVEVLCNLGHRISRKEFNSMNRQYPCLSKITRT